MKKLINVRNLDLSKLIPKMSQKSSRPGTVAYVGKERNEKVEIHIINYNKTDYDEKEVTNLEDLKKYTEKGTISWINITGVHKEDIIQKIGNIFNIHPLTLEDIANTTQRPKIDEYDKYIYLILKMIYLNKKTNELIVEQISIVLWENYIITFQEKKQDIFDQIRNRIKNSKGKIRNSKSDYLMFAIVDNIVDNYFNILEDIGEKIEDIEEELIDNPNQNIQRNIYKLKRRLVYIKKPIWPTREIMNNLIRIDHKLINEETKLYLRDAYDHTIQIIETTESMRDIASGMMDLYLSTISNKMNEIMKVLTIFAAIFIPLTFIAWIYGMNFEYIPELSWHWGYFVFWAVVITLATIMIIYFKKNKWM